MSEPSKQNGHARKPIEGNPLPPELLEEIQRSVARSVKEGFRSEEDIVDGLTEMFEDEHKRSDLRPHIARITTRSLEQHRRIEATWTTPTDCDRLDLAFANLEQHGIVAQAKLHLLSELRALRDRRRDQGGAEATGGQGVHVLSHAGHRIGIRDRVALSRLRIA